MHVHRGDDIIGTESFAIVEFHTLAKIKGPDLGIGRCLPAGRQFADKLAFGRHFGQALKDTAMTHVDHIGVRVCAAVPCV